jgi:hypothetical protein
MIDVERTRKLVSLVTAAVLLWWSAAPVSADIMNECREEAKLYGIPPEQFDDYLHGCVQSRGGYAPEAEDQENAAAPAVEEGMDAVPADPGAQDGEIVEVDANAAQ